MSEKGPSQASQLVTMAKAGYDFVMSTDGRPYGVRRNGPNIVRPFKGRGGVRAALAKQYTEENGSVPSASALADAMAVLEGIADATDPVTVHLRIARDQERIVLDLGTADGTAVVITADGWELTQRSPVLFRRSGAMVPLPVPAQGTTWQEGVELLRDLVNMDDAAFHQLIAWLVAAWIPDIPHPVLTFKGEQGTGKSYTAAMLVGLIDPSPAPKRSQPKDLKAWSVQAFNSWALCLDNVSTIPPWLSDALCRAVTGDGIVDRALYSDDDVVVLSFRRVLAMTTIDAGAMAGDLAERMLLLDLQPITDDKRREEDEMDAAYAAGRPVIIASLLDLLAAVLRELPRVELASKPRLADFARVLAAIDTVAGWSTFADYTAAAKSVNADALEGDIFGSALVAWLDTHGRWTGTASQLLEMIPPPDGYHPKWPKDATRAAGRLKRIAPLLRTVGINYDDTQRTADRARQRLIRLTPVESSGISASAMPLASATPADLHKSADASAGDSVRTASGQRPHDDLADAADTAADTTSPTASATGTPADQQGHMIPDAAGPADAVFPNSSNPGLHCPVCTQPMDPELTNNGHLTHPEC